MTTFTTQEKLAEIKREIALRGAVYARQVGYGKMTRDDADRRIGIMQEILRDYQAIAAKERLI